MCTPSTTEMYRVVNLEDPDTFPGVLVESSAPENANTASKSGDFIINEKDATYSDPREK